MDLVSKVASRKTRITSKGKVTKITLVIRKNQEVRRRASLISKNGEKETDLEKTSRTVRKQIKKVITNQKFKCLNQTFVLIKLSRNPKYL